MNTTNQLSAKWIEEKSSSPNHYRITNGKAGHLIPYSYKYQLQSEAEEKGYRKKLPPHLNTFIDQQIKEKIEEARADERKKTDSIDKNGRQGKVGDFCFSKGYNDKYDACIGQIEKCHNGFEIHWYHLHLKEEKRWIDTRLERGGHCAGEIPENGVFFDTLEQAQKELEQPVEYCKCPSATYYEKGQICEDCGKEGNVSVEERKEFWFKCPKCEGWSNYDSNEGVFTCWKKKCRGAICYECDKDGNKIIVESQEGNR